MWLLLQLIRDMLICAFDTDCLVQLFSPKLLNGISRYDSHIQDELDLKVEMQQLAGAASTLSFCTTCCISVLLAGALCRVHSVSFLLLVGLITVQAVP